MQYQHSFGKTILTYFKSFKIAAERKKKGTEQKKEWNQKEKVKKEKRGAANFQKAS
jgi:hypothetical protein